ncbi:MAG: hypothetical protein PHI97_00700 [Desulfobulbus sp.]|nr:hypothetical protein [Desulfobulbus sp.]
MNDYSIRLKLKTYTGKNPRKICENDDFNKISRELERYINDMILSQNEEVKIYKYYQIAEDTGYSLDVIREHCQSIDGGGNGFTIKKY